MDYRIEDLSQQEIGAIDIYQLAMIQEREAVEQFKMWTNQNGVELVDLRRERKKLNSQMKEKTEDDKFLLSLQERKK